MKRERVQSGTLLLVQMPLKPLSGSKVADLPDLAGDIGWLSAHALEPNFTLMPQWVLPLAEICGSHRKLVPVHALTGEGRPGAFSLFEFKRWRWGLPLAHGESFLGDFPISGTPLLSMADPVGSCAAMLQQAFGTLKVSSLIIPYLTGHHAISSVMVDACAEIGAPICFLDDRQRAALRCNGDYDAWFEETFPRKRRKEFRRLSARLAETGDLQTHTRQSGQPGLETWIDDFLTLEQSSWKGNRGTAIAGSDALTSFLRSALSRLDAAGKLLFWRMIVDGKPVAMMFGVKEGSICWIVKIAHDETLARFSPGVLLVLAATRTMFESDELMFADSCAEPGHPMIDHIWKDRLSVRDVMIGNPSSSTAVFSGLTAMERARRKAHASLKALRKSLRKGKGK